MFLQNTTGPPRSSKLPFWRKVFDTGAVTSAIIDHPYPGCGTEDDPFAISWISDDPQDPLAASVVEKWTITFIAAVTLFATSLVSSAYTGGLLEVSEYFQVSEEIATLGISLYVVGFAFGPLVLSPLSEVYGRRPVLLWSGAALLVFTAGTAGARNIETVIILRFLAGTLGCASMSLATGIIADIWPASSRGLASSTAAAAPFLGPTFGPVAGGFIAGSGGWRWVQGFLAIFIAVMLMAKILLLPETYGPVLLSARAERLSTISGKVYKSKLDVEKGKAAVRKLLTQALRRPFLLLSEPIVILFTIYTSIIYGTLYSFFTAFPIIFMQIRGWSEAMTGLTFMGVVVGVMLSCGLNVLENMKYQQKTLQHGRLPPEDRLPSCFIASIVLPVGLFWFAWTNSPSIHWIVPVASGIPFGYAMVSLFLSTMNYLVDAYTVYAASVLAANCLVRSIIGAAFPIFTSYMYEDMGIHWAASVPAFLSVACVPIPFLFYKYGSRIRQKSRYAAEAEAILNQLLEQAAAQKIEPPRTPQPAEGKSKASTTCTETEMMDGETVGIELQSLGGPGQPSHPMIARLSIGSTGSLARLTQNQDRDTC